MNEQELGRVLQSTTPPDVRIDGWARASRRRAARRRGAVSVAAVALVAAIVVPTAILGASRGQTTVPAGPVESEPWIPAACANPDEGAVPLVDGDLAAGADKVWLCGATAWTGESSVGVPDPLIAEAADAVADFNALEKTEGVADCLPTGLAYTIVAEYPDGTHSAARTDDCGYLRDVTDAERFFREGIAFQELLAARFAEERAATSFEFTGTAGICDSRAYSAWAGLAPTSATRILACPAATGSDRAVEVDGDTLTGLLASLDAVLTQEVHDVADLPEGGPDLVLLTATGDPIPAFRIRAGQSGSDGEQEGYALLGDDGYRLWYPPVELTERLHGTDLEPAPTVTLPSEQGDGLLPNVCNGIRNGAIGIPALPASQDLPSGVARVWLCGDLGFPFSGEIGPIEPLTQDPDRVVVAVNALPAATDVACTEVGGLTYHLVFDYPDGDRRIVSAETVNCQFVGGWNGRTGGAALLGELKGMWETQRDSAPDFTDDVDLCGTYPTRREDPAGVGSFLPVRRSELTRGMVCGLASSATDFTGATVARWLDPEFVALLRGAEPVALDGWRVPEGLPFLVLLNRHGDPVTYRVDSGRRIIMRDETTGAGAVWEPTGRAAELWRAALDGLRVTPFHELPAECGGYDSDAPVADGNRIVSGVACLGDWSVPELGPTLDPAFAAELGRRFAAESVERSWGQFSTANQVVLLDDAGRRLALYWTAQTPLAFVDEAGARVWTLPPDVVEQLRRYGLQFSPDD